MWVPGEVVVEKWSEAADLRRDDSGQRHGSISNWFISLQKYPLGTARGLFLVPKLRFYCDILQMDFKGCHVKISESIVELQLFAEQGVLNEMSMSE